MNVAIPLNVHPHPKLLHRNSVAYHCAETEMNPDHMVFVIIVMQGTFTHFMIWDLHRRILKDRK